MAHYITPSAPRLRSDLIIRRQQTPDGVMVVIKEPRSGEFYRLREVEDFILRQLDGTTPLEEVRRRVESHFGGALADNSIPLFVQKLARGGLLETDKDDARPRKSTHGRLVGGPLYLRMSLFDPTRLFDWLLPRVGFLFTPVFVALAATTICLALVTLAGSWGVFAQDVHDHFKLSTIPYFMAIMFVLVSAHEFAHGLTCRHFGGEVHEVGLILMYFQPAFFCNVSDAWLFEERAKRMWVGFAGPFFELFLWALAVLVWRLTAVETWINFVALLAMAATGIKTLVNFNPLVKYDGYYLLSDFLGVPNLRRRAFGHVGRLLKSWFGWSVQPAPPATAREQRIYLIYGLIATVYSFSLMSLVAIKTGAFLIDVHQPLGLAMLGFMLTQRLKRRVRRLMGKGHDEEDLPRSGVEDDLEEEPASVVAEDGPEEPARVAEDNRRTQDRHRTQDKGHREDVGGKAAWSGLLERTVRRVAGLRKGRRWRRLILPTAATILVLVVAIGRTELRVSGPVSVLPEKNTDIRSEVEGIVESVFVDEGDRVQVGDLIARLSGHALVNELEATIASIRETSATLEKLEAGPTAAEIAVQRAAVEKAKDQANYASMRLSKLKQAFAVEAVSAREFEDAQQLANTAEHELDEAQRHLDVLTVGTRREDIEEARAKIEGLRAHGRFLQDQVGRLELRSPVAGVVATPSRQLEAMEGQLVPSGGLIAKVYEFETVAALITISEKEIGDVRPGLPVELRSRAYPDLTFHGRVTSVAVAADASLASEGTPPPTPSSSPGRTFMVTCRMDNRSLQLKPGMTGQAKVLCGSRRNWNLARRQLARFFKVEVWSWW